VRALPRQTAAWWSVVAVGTLLASRPQAGVAAKIGEPSGPQTFRARVDVVEVPVLVRDPHGQLVTDLTREDFKISDQGKPQTIETFERIISGRSAEVWTAHESPAPGDLPARQESGRVFLLVLDSFHVAAHRALAVRKYAREFVERQLGPHDLAAVVTVGGAGSNTELTSETARLFATVSGFNGIKLRSATVEAAEEKRQAGEGMILHSGRDPSDEERASRARSLADALNALASTVSGLNGRRKVLLLFSEGIDYNLFDATGSVQRHGSDVSRALQQAIGTLMATNVAVYAIDPRALSSAEGDRVEAPLYEQPVRTNNLIHPGVEGEFESSIRSLRNLTEPTGGFATVSTNDISGALSRIADETSTYYVLSYVPTDRAKPGQFRKIGVRLVRQDFRVTARKGYLVPPEPIRR
jgi:VWFA-related protein